MSCVVYRNDNGEITKVTASNGKESILYDDILRLSDAGKEGALRLWARIHTSSFKNWFGQWEEHPQEASKIVDSNGEPRVMYLDVRGKGSQLFDYTPNGPRPEEGEKGFYFTPDKTRSQDKYAVFLNVRNPQMGTEPIEKTKINRSNHDAYIQTDGSGNIVKVVTYRYNEVKSVFNRGEFSKHSDGSIFRQGEEGSVTPASTETLGKIKNFLDRIGVDVKTMQDLQVDGERVGANGLANILEGIIEVVKGKEASALPEEAMHFAVELLEQKNPVLFNSMLNKIGQYDLYNEVLQEYKDIYKTEDGKPDIRKIKKEAIAKVLAETVIYKNEGSQEAASRLLQTKSWWDRFVDWFKGLMGKAKMDPFEETAGKVVNDPNSFGKATDVAKDQTYYQKRDDLITKINDEESKIGKDAVGHYTRGGERVKNTVDNIVEKFYEEKSRSKRVAIDETLKAIDEYKEATKGKGATDIEDILGRYIDENGKLRDSPLAVSQPSALSVRSRTFYNTLDKNFEERLKSYPGGTTFFHGTELFDQKRNLVGKADLIAITPEGKVDITQFKFPDISNKTGVLKTFEQTAYNLELEELRRILENSYGVSKKDFGLTRAIPVRAYYSWVDRNDKTKGAKLINLKIGNVDVSLEKDESLLPVASQSESTGNKELDGLLAKLRGLLDKIQNERVDPAEADQKGIRIATLNAAIRTLQVQKDATKTIDNSQLLLKRSEALYKTLLTSVDGADPSQMTIGQINSLSADLLDAKDNLLLYKDLDIVMERVYPDADPKQQVFINQASDIARRSSRLIRNLEDLEDRVRTDIFAKKQGIKDELNPEKALTWYRRMIRSLSQSSIKAGEELWSLVKRINNQYQIRFSERLKTLEGHMEHVKEWANGNGGMKGVYKKIFSFDDKGRWRGKFISQTDKTYYENLEEAKDKKNHEWIRNNVDLVAYKEWYDNELVKRQERSKTLRLDPDDDINESLVKKNLEDFINNYDIDKETSANKYNYILNGFPKKDLWMSKEFKELQKPENKAILDLYNYWQDVLKKSHDIGLIASWERKTFFPNIRTEFLEKSLVSASNIVGSFFDQMEIHNEDSAFGKQDHLTGEPIDNVHARYVQDLGKTAKDTDGNYFQDYSEKSMDLFKVMSLWERELIRYELKTESESIAKLLASTESRKKALQVNRMGNLIKDKGVPIQIDNTTNTKYVKDFIDAIYYGKKLDQEADVTFSVPYGSAVKKINALFGHEVFPVPEQDSIKVSGSKALQTFNRYFVAKTLGGNPLTALSQLFGGTANAYINSGKFFTKTDLLAGQAKMVSGAFYDSQGKIQAGLLQYFLPTLEDASQEKIRELSVNRAVKYLSSEWLMFMQRKADAAVQIPIALAFFQNTTIKDGKLVNIREMVKRENGYDNIYDLPYQEQAAKKAEIEEKINQAKQEGSLLKIATIKDDKIVLPGIERMDDTVVDLRQRVIEFTKDALGNTSTEDLSLYKRSVMMQSFFMFKNWIPRMVDVRGQSLKYNPGTDSYEWGRIRMMYRALQTNGLSTIGSLIKQLGGNEKSIIDIAKKLYAEKKEVFDAQGEEFNMPEADFIDMYLKGVRSEFKELGLTAALLGILIFARVHAPGKDDDPQIKGMYNWSLRAIDKLTDELSFFYDPTSFTNIANGSVFPAVSLLTDAQRLMMNGIKDAYYYSTGNEKGMQSIHSAKYLLKTLPLVNQMVSYGAVFSHDFAKEWGIQLSSQNGRR